MSRLTSGTDEAMSVRLIDSKPPAMPMLMTPDWMAEATLMKACSPLEHYMPSQHTIQHI